MREPGSGTKNIEAQNSPETERWNSFREFAERNSGMSEVAVMRDFINGNPFRAEYLLEYFGSAFPDFDQNKLVRELLIYIDELSETIGGISSKKMIVTAILAHLPTLSRLTDVTAGLLTHAHRDCHKIAAEAVAKSVTSFSDIQNQHIKKAVRNCVSVLPNPESIVEWLPQVFPGNLREACKLVPFADKHKLVTFLSLVPVYAYMQDVKTLPYHPFNQDDDTKTLYGYFIYYMESGQFERAEETHQELLGIYRIAVEGRVQIVDMTGDSGMLALTKDNDMDT